jgi:hypothetical protein
MSKRVGLAPSASPSNSPSARMVALPRAPLGRPDFRRFVWVFQFAERTSGNKEFIFPTGNLMVAASPATPPHVQPNN